ncbi:MAG: DNA mismatch repair protein MutS [Candidatus Woesearchaeota archaeon]
MEKLTPAMKQYMDIKNKYPDCIVMFRMGDFYEMFFEDARICSRVLEITLTKRGHINSKSIPLAGIPYHALEPYLAKLIKNGYKVAICEQIEDPKKAKGVVKRDVTRVVTPGTVIEEKILESSSNNYLACVYIENKNVGVSIVDISTGEFFVFETDFDNFKEDLLRFRPSEVIIQGSFLEKLNELKNYFFISSYSDRHFIHDYAKEKLLNHFNILNLNCFEIENKKIIISSAGALIDYLQETQKNTLSFIRKIKKFNKNNYMKLDFNTIRNLELIENLNDKSTKQTLLSILNKTKTSLGRRLINKIILQPLLNIDEINYRLDGVEELINNVILKEEIKEVLREIFDIERIFSKISYGNSNARDLIMLKKSLIACSDIKKLIANLNTKIMCDIKNISDFSNLVNYIDSAIVDEPPILLRDGGFIKYGYNKELDELYDLSKNSKKVLKEIEVKEKQKTKIKTLKIKYNRVFGYFIEVSKTQLSLVPEHYIRKQTTANSERYITEELKEIENKILNAEEKICEIELNLYLEIVNDIVKYGSEIQNSSNLIAILDLLVSFADVSLSNNYVRPIVTNDYVLDIKKARHPVIEKNTSNFIENDIFMDEENRTFIITGPNMAGKSTFMRQNALIILIAQIGCFVPAEFAKIGIVDRIYTRVGASDDISSGQSTFMMEMMQTAVILNNATRRSFIILDEIGRGTSTFDGVSIAWSVAEYITKNLQCKTLFATHYHVLNELSSRIKEVKNYNVSVYESDDEIKFLHKINEGGTDKSYGIHVAKIAGLPADVILNAKIIQKNFEKNDLNKNLLKSNDFNNLNNQQKDEKNNYKKNDDGKLNKKFKNINQKSLNEIFD